MEYIIAKLEDIDPLQPPFENFGALEDEVKELIGPYLLNPDRHGEHAAIIAEYTSAIRFLQIMNPLLRIYDLPVLRGVARRNYRKGMETFRNRVLEARANLLKTAEPGRIEIDVIPLINLETKPDWQKIGKRLVLLHTRAAVSLEERLEIRALSHTIEIRRPSGCQFLDTFPSSAMELAGQREAVVSKSGKFVDEISGKGDLSSEAKIGIANVKLNISASEKRSYEIGAASSDKLNVPIHVSRVISTAVGRTAQWEMLRTPTQILMGSHDFLSTVLVPDGYKALHLSLRHEAKVENWGPTDLLMEAEIPIPPAD